MRGTVVHHGGSVEFHEEELGKVGEKNDAKGGARGEEDTSHKPGPKKRSLVKEIQMMNK